jgi:hypothetical protein
MYWSSGFLAQSFTCMAHAVGMSMRYVSRSRTCLRAPCAHIPAPFSSCTFWRFLIQIPLSESEMGIQYSINDGLEMTFFVPGRQQTMRVAAHSVSDPNRYF